MHKSRLGAVIIDCHTDDLDAAAAFWAQSLGYRVGDEQPDARYRHLLGPGGEVSVLVQAVEHDSRVHLDIESDDIEAEVARLESLGARRVEALKGWVVMEAPTGHRFCVIGSNRPDLAEHGKGNVWD